MEIINFGSNISPLSTSYVGDVDVFFKGILDNSEDDISIFRENYLKNSNNKINNYSSLYLTDKKTLTDFIDLKRLEKNDAINIFNTSLINLSGGYLTIDGNTTDITTPLFFTEKYQKFIDPTHRIFEVILLDSTRAKIIHRNRNKTVYALMYEFNFYFSYEDDNIKSIFNYVLDKESGKLSLLKDVGGVLKSVVINSSGLLLDNDVNKFITNYFNVNYYVQTLEPKLNTSWVSYNPIHKNTYSVNEEKSIKNLKNNLLVSTQYTYITGNNIESNILLLKNQKTNKNYSYRSDYLEKNNKNVPTIDNRTYYGLFTGNEQERGDYGITLGYEFNNADYKLEKDKYTTFKTPESLYPYNKININDLGLNYKGAIAGENPHVSDKIFRNKITNKQNGGEYLCSWLRKERNGGSIWLDRYYYPDKTTYAKALESTVTYEFNDPINEVLLRSLSANEYYDIPYVYNSLSEESEHTPQTVKDAIYGNAFFDKRSDLMIEPDTEYIYHRIGDEYVKKIVDALDNDLLINGLDLKNSNDATITIEGDIDNIEYIFNNDSYARIENYQEINKTHKFTISFWGKSDDWSKGFGHQILGNLNDKGFSLLYDEKITPMIMVQSDKNVYVYNTNFSLLDKASLTNEEDVTNKIKDIYRTEHLNSYYTINIS